MGQKSVPLGRRIRFVKLAFFVIGYASIVQPGHDPTGSLKSPGTLNDQYELALGDAASFFDFAKLQITGIQNAIGFDPSVADQGTQALLDTCQPLSIDFHFRAAHPGFGVAVFSFLAHLSRTEASDPVP
jgi:hypothetical protein